MNKTELITGSIAFGIVALLFVFVMLPAVEGTAKLREYQEDSFKESYKACTYIIQGNDYMYVRVHCDRANPDTQATVIYFSDMCKDIGGRLISDTGCFLELSES